MKAFLTFIFPHQGSETSTESFSKSLLPHYCLHCFSLQQTEYQSLFEQFSPTLIQHIPKQLVELWKQRNLEPRRMIPSLVTQTESNNEESIRCAIDYLEHCVYKLKNEETAIHNYLVSLYCKIPEERPLLQYLNSQGQVCFIRFFLSYMLFS